ncbi:Translation Initiation factor eIF- 4e-like [Trinorchestia longiramus]|nr:Translation Initiation factor eIF- 4e-like [Trinorchestia longiramus]
MASQPDQVVDLSTFMDIDEYTLLASDEVENPLEELECWFIWEIKDKYKKKYNYTGIESGKWMFFVKNRYLHQMWRKACFLYRDGKLDGIKLMKVSTAKENPRSSDDDRGVIIFYCGPCSNEKLMLRYGMNLVRMFKYTSDRGFMPYKSDAQTYLGTIATGNKINSLYTLPVPRYNWEYTKAHEPAYWSEPVREKTSSEVSNWRAKEVKIEWTPRKKVPGKQTDSSPADACVPSDGVVKVPSQTTDLLWLSEPENYQYVKDGLPVDVGQWWMFISRSCIDESWQKACQLFRKGDWPSQIQSVRVSTKLSSYGRKVMILSFFCEVADKETLKVIGTTLAKAMEYKNEKGSFSYRYPDGTIFSVEVETC